MDMTAHEILLPMPQVGSGEATDKKQVFDLTKLTIDQLREIA
jgi:hypothetical protein